MRSFVCILFAAMLLVLVGVDPRSARATVSTTSSTTTAQGNGVTTAFSYNFPISSAAYAVVTVTNGTVTPITTITLSPTQYTITGIGGATGGTVTYPKAGSPLPSGYSITISRVLPLIQTTSLCNQGPTFCAIEHALDYLTYIAQQLWSSIAFIQGELTNSATIPVPTNIRVVSSIAALQAIGSTAAINYPYVNVQSYRDGANDGGGGAFFFYATCPGTINTGTYISVTGVSGACYARQIAPDQPYSVRWFGAYGDDSHDDSAAINAAISAANAINPFGAPGPNSIEIPGGFTYKIVSSPIKWPLTTAFISNTFNTRFVIRGTGDKGAILDCVASPCMEANGFVSNSNSSVALSGLNLTNNGAQGATIGIKLDSLQQAIIENNTVYGFFRGMEGGDVAQINVVTIRNNMIFNASGKNGYGIYITGPSANSNAGNTIYKNYILDVNTGIYITSADGSFATYNTTISENAFVAMVNGIDIVHAYFTNIIGNDFEGQITGQNIINGADSGGTALFTNMFGNIFIAPIYPTVDDAAPTGTRCEASATYAASPGPSGLDSEYYYGCFATNTDKAFAEFEVGGAAIGTVNQAFNVASITYISTGIYLVAFQQDIPCTGQPSGCYGFGNSHYLVTIGTNDASDGLVCRMGGRAANGVQVVCRDGAGTVEDPTTVMVRVEGN